jgi:stage II sporulation protein D
MKNKVRWLLFIALLSGQTLCSQTARIGIFYNRDPEKIFFQFSSGDFKLINEQGLSWDLNSGQNYILSAKSDSVVFGDQPAVKSTWFKIEAREESQVFRLSLQNGNGWKNFSGSLSIISQAGKLKLVNSTSMDDYIAGVIQAEVGTGNGEEFQKMKAVICRTYALFNWGRHEQEGFNLCDKVHCQVYPGNTRHEPIRKCVKETRGQVLVDDSLKLINPLFHSNCGGQTCNSEDVWNKPLPYLVSVKDPWCKNKPSYSWEKKIARKEWDTYLRKKFMFPSSDSLFFQKLIAFNQDDRKKYLIEDGFCIPLRTVREDWNLRSTFFTIQASGDFVVLKGRGFGHGVGLCQEGAMEMAKKGKSIKSILEFYYNGAYLVDLERIDFFRSALGE